MRTLPGRRSPRVTPRAVLTQHPGSCERFVIGTLGSLVWSAAVGGVGAALLGTRVLGV